MAEERAPHRFESGTPVSWVSNTSTQKPYRIAKRRDANYFRPRCLGKFMSKRMKIHAPATVMGYSEYILVWDDGMLKASEDISDLIDHAASHYPGYMLGIPWANSLLVTLKGMRGWGGWIGVASLVWHLINLFAN